MDRSTCSVVFPNIHPNEMIRENQSSLWNRGYLETARNMPVRTLCTRYFYLSITFSVAFSCCFFRRYSLIAFPRVCLFLVTFLKLITSAPSASFVSFPSRWSIRVPTLPLHLFPAVAAFLSLISANSFALTNFLSLSLLSRSHVFSS